jgi:peptidoglycan biosynthesis protein MviN/MurJ (putative lipid II flippase)
MKQTFVPVFNRYKRPRSRHQRKFQLPLFIGIGVAYISCGIGRLVKELVKRFYYETPEMFTVSMILFLIMFNVIAVWATIHNKWQSTSTPDYVWQRIRTRRRIAKRYHIMCRAIRVESRQFPEGC